MGIKFQRFHIGIVLLFFCRFSANAQYTTSKPWTYWWWMGNAVNEKELSYQLESIADAGLGGVHIIPIFGVKGREAQHIDFLSKVWIEKFQHVLKEAKRLNLGVDLTMGTGWPFGGPDIPLKYRAHQLKVQGGVRLISPTNQMVKRASPGGEGYVLDHFNKAAIAYYLQRFQQSIANQTLRPRALYNDSYEVYGANWTLDFPQSYYKKYGKIFEPTDTSASNIHSWHEHLSDLMYEEFASPWTMWCKNNGMLTRYEAHGSPANILDLYALADIPETEAFGSKQYNIPGYRMDPDYEPARYGRPELLAMKMASSAANITEKKLVSSETGTWLGNHFKVTLAQLKPELDELFVAGINHVFFHGMTYSPRDAGYPGWLFYASTNFGMSSHLWPDMPELNRYITNIQAQLQNCTHDNDVLLYFPIHEIWQSKNAKNNGVHFLDVHFSDQWLIQTPTGIIGQKLLDKGYSFDFVSDLQLVQLANGKLAKQGYKTILIPQAEHMPLSTRLALEVLQNKGMGVEYIQDAQKFLGPVTKVSKETLTEQKLKFIRKKSENGFLYFIANQDTHFYDGYVDLFKLGKFVAFTDPMTQKSGNVVPTKAGVRLQIKPGQSLLIHSSSVQQKHPMWSYHLSKTNIVPLKNKWNLILADNQQVTLDTLKSWTELGDTAVTGYYKGVGRYTNEFDLTTVPKDGISIQLGDVRETVKVFINDHYIQTVWSLPYDVDIPPHLLKKGKNQIKLYLRNTSANEIRKIDRLDPSWKRFYDINIVDIRYSPFDASTWQSMPSGLLGPVKIWR